MSRTLRPLAALAIVALIGAGCGSAENGNTGTASSYQQHTASSGADKKLTKQEKGVKFAECMRANGVPHFPDPDPNGDTNFGVDVTREVWLQGRRRLQGPEATGRAELKADSQGAVGEPEVRPVRSRERREGLSGPGQR